jgi:hypothetical protein
MILTVPSCFEVSDTVNLKKDGTGTIVEEVIFGGQMAQMLGNFAALNGAGAEAPEIFSENSANKRAEKLGKGVTLTKFEKIDKNGSKGARMTFSFTDINTVTLSSSDSLSGLQEMAPQEVAPEEKPMTFQYKDGILTMSNPSAEPDQEQAEKAKKAAAEMKENLGGEIPDPASPEGAQMQAMMMEMFKDMKMSIKINIEDGIAETNATHRDGNIVTLAEVDFGKLMKNPENMKGMNFLEMQDPTAMQKNLAKIPGVKIEMKKEISIKVK